MKKALAIVLAAALAASLAGCGMKIKEESTVEDTTAELTTVETTVPAAETTAAEALTETTVPVVTETTTEVTTAAPVTTTMAPVTTTMAPVTTTAAPVQTTAAPVTEAPTTAKPEPKTEKKEEKTTKKAEPTTEKKAEKKTVKLSSVKSKVLSAAGVSGATDLDQNAIGNLYGISAGDCAQAEGFMIIGGAFPEEGVMIEAKDAKAASRVASSLKTRLDDVKGQAENYDADSFAKVKSCKVVQQGNFVGLFITAKHTSMENTFAASVK